MEADGHSKNNDWLRNLIGFSMIVALLYFGREVLVPFSLSLLMAFLLKPMVNWLQKRGLPRVPAVLIAFTVTFLLLVGGMFQVGAELARLAQDLPRYKSELATKMKGVRVWEKSLTHMFGDFDGELSAEASLDSVEKKNADSIASNAGQSTTGDDKLSTKPGPDSEDLDSADSVSMVSDSVTSNRDDAAKEKQSIEAGSDPSKPLFVEVTKKSSISMQSWAESVGTLLGPLGTTGLVIVFTLFLMIYQDDLRDRMIKLLSGGQYVTTTRALNESAERISAYLMAQAIINFSYGGIISVGLWVIGLTFASDHGFPNVLLWGFLAAVLRFVPYIGPVVSSLFPLAIALAVFPGFNVFAAVLTLIVLVELVSNNVLEPWLYGSSTGLSAMSVIFASVFWGWIWGPVGLLLATPLTVCLVVLGKHFDAFRQFHTLLGDEEPLPPATRFYQRLLAGNATDALRLAQQQAKTDSHVNFLDNVLIPTIARIRSDREAARLSRSDELSLNSSLDTILKSLSQPQISASGSTSSQVNDASTTDTSAKSPLERPQSDANTALFSRILLIPSHHAYEALILEQLSACLRCSWVARTGNCNFAVETLSTKISTKQVQQILTKSPPSIVVIGVVPPGGLLQAEFLCEVVQSCSPNCRVLVTWFGKPRKFDKLLIRLKKKGVSYVPTSIEQTLNYIESIVESLELERRSVTIDTFEPSSMDTNGGRIESKSVRLDDPEVTLDRISRPLTRRDSEDATA